MSYLSELRTERRTDRWANAQIRIAEDKAAAERAANLRAERDAVRAVRKARRQAARKAWFRRLPDHGMTALWATMIVLPVALAWQAQAMFAATTLGFASPWHHLFPAAVECAAWLCAFESIRRVRAGLSAGLLPTYMWVLAGSAAVINGAHGWRDGGPVAGLSLAFLSVLGVFLHHIRQGLDGARATGGRSRLVLWRRLRYPRLSIAAASLRAARDDLTPAAAWQLAWEDRYGIGPDAGRRERRVARKVVRHTARADRRAARTGDVTIVNGRVQRGFAQAVREHIDREREAVTAQAQLVLREANDALLAAAMLYGPDVFGPGGTEANPVPEQGRELSGRARELLPALREAITNGDVSPNPSVKAIRRWVTTALREPLGVPVAQELRTAVRGLRAVPTTDHEDQVDDAADEIREVSA